MKWRSCRKGTVDGMMIWQKYDTFVSVIISLVALYIK